MAFPLAAVGVLNSVFFGVYGNTLRLWYSTTEDDSKSTKRSPDSTSTGSSCSATGTVKLEGVEETKALVDLKPSYLAICIAGGFAGAVQGVPATPIDLVKVRLQAQTGGNILKGFFCSFLHGPQFSLFQLNLCVKCAFHASHNTDAPANFDFQI